MTDRDHEIYVIAKCDHTGQCQGPVKIGISANADTRLRQIQTSCPFPIAVFYRFSAPNREWAERVERCFHDTREEKRLHGEWFDYEPEEAAAIVALAYDVLLVCSLGPKASDERLLNEIRQQSGIATIFAIREKVIST